MDWLHWVLILAFIGYGFISLYAFSALDWKIRKRNQMLHILVNRLDRHGEEVNFIFLEYAAIARLERGYEDELSDQPVSE